MKQRLINCDFINSGQFTGLTNKAKLLYLYMITNADDVGFVDNITNWITLLGENDTPALELLNNDYKSALEELGNMGLIYVFTNKYGHKVYLVRHWWLHNKWKKGLRTTYSKYRAMVEIVDYEYVWKESSKENKLNQSNVNQNNTNQNNYSWNELVSDLDRKEDYEESITENREDIE